MFFIKEEAGDDGIGDSVDHVGDTCKVGVSIVHIVGRCLVVFDFGNVEPGYAVGIRRLKGAIWNNFRAIKDLSISSSLFDLNGLFGIVAMLPALGKEILILSHEEPFPVVIGAGDIACEASKVCHEFSPNFEDGLLSTRI